MWSWARTGILLTVSAIHTNEKVGLQQVSPLSQHSYPLTLHFKSSMHTKYSLSARSNSSIWSQEWLKTAEQLYEFFFASWGGRFVFVWVGRNLFGWVFCWVLFWFVWAYFFPVCLLLTQCWEQRKHIACKYPPSLQLAGNQQSSNGMRQWLPTAAGMDVGYWGHSSDSVMTQGTSLSARDWWDLEQSQTLSSIATALAL